MGSISKAIKRVIPKEIQPILPIAASMFGGPLVGSLIGKSALGSGIMSALGPIGGRAFTSGLTSAATDLLTSGKIDARNVGIAALMGGGGQYLKGDPTTIGPKTGFQNIKSEIGEALAPDVTNMSKLSDLTTPLSVATTTGGTISAYDAAEEARKKYEEEMAGREADSAADRQSRIDYISRYMGMAGFSQSEIDDALSRYGYKTGGRVGFSSGGSGTLGDSMQDMKILIMKNQIIDAGGGGFGGKDLDDKTDDEIIEIYEGLFGQGKANGGRIGYKIGGSTVTNFLAKFGIGRPTEEIMQRMFEERKKEILSDMFDAEAGTGAYSMEQMQKADEMATKQAMQELEEYKMRIGMELDNPPEGSVSDDMIDQIMEPREEGRVKEAMGGRIYKADGGIMNLKTGGMPAEMDLRPGGFVPIGVKEKADDVPARLSKNEFVMTADAVRAAGGGSVNKGAKRMYDLMHKLEARV